MFLLVENLVKFPQMYTDVLHRYTRIFICVHLCTICEHFWYTVKSRNPW